MRGCVARRNRQRPQQRLLRPFRLAGGTLGERQVDERVDAGGIKRERRVELGRSRVDVALAQQCDAVVVVGAGVTGSNEDGSLELTCGIVEQILLLVEKSQVVVRL